MRDVPVSVAVYLVFFRSLDDCAFIYVEGKRNRGRGEKEREREGKRQRKRREARKLYGHTREQNYVGKLQKRPNAHLPLGGMQRANYKHWYKSDHYFL